MTEDASMFDKLVTAALLTISLILLTGFNRPSGVQGDRALPLINKASAETTPVVKDF